MTRAGVPDKEHVAWKSPEGTIIKDIASVPVNFDFSAPALALLHSSVSEAVIDAMLKTYRRLPARARRGSVR